VTILSSAKPKKIPRTTKGLPFGHGLGFSSESDHGVNPNEGPRTADKAKDDHHGHHNHHNHHPLRTSYDSEHSDDHPHPVEGVMDGDHVMTRPALTSRDSNGSSASPEPDFVDKALGPLKDSRPFTHSLDHHREDRQTLAKIVSTQREKLVLMNSILKYIESKPEMDTIHRACFNLWKDWYRCYGSITNQFQAAFMAVCETLLGNVDSRALARDPPSQKVNDSGCKSVEQITFDLSTQISHLKHAFAIEQLHTSSAGKTGDDAQNVAQIIDGMEPNVWRIVQHIVFEYLSSSCWMECKHILFNLFLNQYETVHRRLDREFISSSSFGVYTLVCQLCGVLEPLSSSNASRRSSKTSLKSRKSMESSKAAKAEQGPSADPESSQMSTDIAPKAKSAELPPVGQGPDDGFHLDRSRSVPSDSPEAQHKETESKSTTLQDATAKSLKPLKAGKSVEGTSSTSRETEQKEDVAMNGASGPSSSVDQAPSTESLKVSIADQSFLIDADPEDISSTSSASFNDLDPELPTPTPIGRRRNQIAEHPQNPTAFTNQQLLLGLDWYYAVCRLEDLLTNKREDHLSPKLYTLYQPVFDPLFKSLVHSEDSNMADISPLIHRMIEDRDFTALTAKYEELQREDIANQSNPPRSTKGKKHEETFLSLLSRVISSCIAWICKELYYTYRMSEFCVLLTQLLADPGPFKTKLEERRSTRIIRLHKRFNLPSDQTFVNSFSCALDTGRFLHQGKIYFFKDYVCFYANMLGMIKTQQKFLLPVSEIKMITPKSTAWVFNNAIELQMKDGRNFIFRTFMSRDSTYELLEMLIHGQIDWEEIEKQQAEELEKEKQEELLRLQKEEEREKERALKEKERALKEKERALKEKEREREKEREKEMERMNGREEKDSKLSNTMARIKEKVLNTDVKLLLAPENRRTQASQSMRSIGDHGNGNGTKASITSTSAVQLGHITESNVTLKLNRGSVAVTATRSAPSSPTLSGRDGNRKRGKDNKSDSETHDSRTLSVTPFEMDDSDVSLPSIGQLDMSGDEVEEEEVWQRHPEEKEMVKQVDSALGGSGGAKSTGNGGGDQQQPSQGANGPSKEELEAKCATMNTVGQRWIHHEKPKVEKDFELMVDHEFEHISVDEFWNTFWSNEATFSPVDWMKGDSLNSDIRSSPWKVDGSFGNPGEEWFHRILGCTTKLEDLPSFLPKSISQCTSTQYIRYCNLSPHFYVVHKRLEVADIPYADCYDTHIKIEFTQSARVEVDDGGRAALDCSTHLRFYFAVEWKKSTFVKSMLRSRTLTSIKKDAQSYSEHIDGRVRALWQSKNAGHEAAGSAITSAIPSTSSRSSPKKLRKPRSRSRRGRKQRVSPQRPQRRRSRDDEDNVPSSAVATDDDYDFVFKVGNRSSYFRFRVLLSCCTRSRDADPDSGCGKWTIAVVVMVTLLMVVAMLYTFGAVLGLINSLSTYYRTAQIGPYPMNNGIYSPYQCAGSECEGQHDIECAELLQLIADNPSFNVLQATYDSLKCPNI